MSGTVDRRIEARRTINHEFRSVEQFIGEYVVNLSRGGVFIRSDDPLPVGTRVNLKFTVIFEDLELIEGVGEVVRVVAPGERRGPAPEARALYDDLAPPTSSGPVAARADGSSRPTKHGRRAILSLKRGRDDFSDEGH